MRALGVRVMVGVCLALGLAASARVDAAPRADAVPPELLATVAIGPVTTLRGLTAYLEAVSPGAGEGLGDRVLRRELAGMVGASSLDGVDPASWMYLLVVATDAAPAIGLVAKVADGKRLATSAGGNALVKRGWAVLGPKLVLDRVGAYAIATIAAQPVPKAQSATVYLPNVLARYRNEIEIVRGQVVEAAAQAATGDRMGQFMASMFGGMFGVLDEVERIVVTLEASADMVALDLALAPRARSRLAGFVAAQRPSDYALLGKLPAAGSPWAVVAGHLDSGPYRDGLITLTTAFYGPELADLRPRLGALLKATTGEFAATLQLSPGAGMSATQLFGVSDAAAADRAIAGMLDLFKAGRTFEAMQIPTTIKVLPDAPSHDGVALRGYRVSYDLSKVAAPQRQTMERMAPTGGTDTRIAVFDGAGTVVTGPNNVAEVGHLIDAARGKAARFTAPAAIAEFLAGSRARKESLAMAFDTAGMIALFTGKPPPGGANAPLQVSLGFADRRAHLRLAAPAASVRAAARAGQP